MQIEDADNWKQLALEMVVTLAENGNTLYTCYYNYCFFLLAAPMIRKHDKFLPQIGLYNCVTSLDLFYFFSQSRRVSSSC